MWKSTGIAAAVVAMGLSSLPANAELVGEWLFEDGLADTSGNSIDTRAYGDVSEITRDGESARYFNGTNGYLALDKGLVAPLEGLGVSVWFNTSVNAPSAPNSTNWALLDFDRSEYFSLSVSNVGQIWFGMFGRENGLIMDFFSDKTFNDGEWHQAVLSYGQENGLKVHVDGELVLEGAYRGMIGKQGVRRYGFIGDGSESTTFNGARNQYYYEGGIDNVVMLDNELTDTHVSNLFSSGYSVVSDVPVPGVGAGLLGLGLLAGARRRRQDIKKPASAGFFVPD